MPQEPQASLPSAAQGVQHLPPAAGQRFTGGEAELGFDEGFRILQLLPPMQATQHGGGKRIEELAQVQHLHEGTALAGVMAVESEEHRRAASHFRLISPMPSVSAPPSPPPKPGHMTENAATASLTTRPMAQHRILIVGGGAAGLTTASQLLRARPGLAITILEPSADHYYQPGWTLVGGGVFSLEQTHRAEADLIPDGVEWLQEAVASFDPANNSVTTTAGTTLSYDALVVATGIKLCWEQIKGLPEALGRGGITSNYRKDLAPYTWQTIRGFKGGTALFTFPQTPIKCAGAPQKIMYLADDVFQRSPEVAQHTRVIYATATPGIFGVPAFAEPLKKVVARRGIETRFQHTLVEVRAESSEAVFRVQEGDSSREEVIPFAMIHVTPPMAAPDVVASSPLAVQGAGGWVEVDKATTQHVRYPNVFSLGDVSSLPNSKTAAAVRGQAPVVVANLLAHLDGRPLEASYDGYACCPLITGYGRTIMAEFTYDGTPAPSFPLDPTQERWSMWMLKKNVLPWIYWNRMLKGYPHERRYVPGVPAAAR